MRFVCYIVCCNCMYVCTYLFGYRYLSDGDTDRREILHDDRSGSRTPGHKISPWPKIPNFDCEYLENGKSQRYMSNKARRNIGSTTAFLKCIAWDGSPQTVPYKEKNMYFFARGQTSRADRPENLHDGRAVSHALVSPLLVAIGLGVSKMGVKKWYFLHSLSLAYRRR